MDQTYAKVLTHDPTLLHSFQIFNPLGTERRILILFQFKVAFATVRGLSKSYIFVNIKMDRKTSRRVGTAQSLKGLFRVLPCDIDMAQRSRRRRKSKRNFLKLLSYIVDKSKRKQETK